MLQPTIVSCARYTDRPFYCACNANSRRSCSKNSSPADVGQVSIDPGNYLADGYLFEEIDRDHFEIHGSAVVQHALEFFRIEGIEPARNSIRIRGEPAVMQAA